MWCCKEKANIKSELSLFCADIMQRVKPQLLDLFNAEEMRLLQRQIKHNTAGFIKLKGLDHLRKQHLPNYIFELPMTRQISQRYTSNPNQAHWKRPFPSLDVSRAAESPIFNISSFNPGVPANAIYLNLLEQTSWHERSRMRSGFTAPITLKPKIFSMLKKSRSSIFVSGYQNGWLVVALIANYKLHVIDLMIGRSIRNNVVAFIDLLPLDE